MLGPKSQLIEQVTNLVQTDPEPYNETTLADWITEGDTDDMTPEEIAAEWDSLGNTERD